MWFKSYEHFHQLTKTGSTNVYQRLVHQKGCYACQWLDIVNMYKYAKFEQNMQCGSNVMSIFTYCNEQIDGWTDIHTARRTHAMIIVHTFGSFLKQSKMNQYNELHVAFQGMKPYTT